MGPQAASGTHRLEGPVNRYSLDLLHEEVDRLGSVGERGGVPGQHLRLLAANGAGQTSELAHLGVTAVLVECVGAVVGLDDVGGGVHLARQLRRLTGPEQVGGGHPRRWGRPSSNPAKFGSGSV